MGKGGADRAKKGKKDAQKKVGQNLPMHSRSVFSSLGWPARELL